MSPTQRSLSRVFATVYDTVGSALIVSGLILTMAARAIRRDLDAQDHAQSAPPVEDRKAADLDELREGLRRARTAHPGAFTGRVAPFGFGPRDPNAN